MTLTANQQTEISAAVRHQRYLLQIDIDGSTLRMASGGTVTWNSQTWSKTGLNVANLSNGKGGMETVRIEVQNQNNAFTAYAISNSFSFARVQLWEFYGTGNPALEDPVKKFDGEVVGIPSMEQKIVFDCATKGAVTKRIPSLTLTAPDVNHLPYSGQFFVIGTEVFTVEVN